MDATDRCDPGRPRWVRLGLLVLLTTGAALLMGCSTVRSVFIGYPSQAEGFYVPYRAGAYDKASDEAASGAASRKGTGDEVLWRLELGKVLQAAGHYQGSNQAFDEAAVLITGYDERAKVNVRDLGNEGLAALANQNVLPYRAYAYDRIMLYTYKALNYVLLGDFDGARVELRRAYERQQEAVALFEKEITEAEQEAGSHRGQVDSASSDPGLSGGLNQMYAELDQYKAFADFVNPLTVYLDALLFLTTGQDAGDFERAQKSFERVIGMVGPAPALTTDLEAVKARFAGKELAPTVYVIFENGLGPVRDEWRIDLPIPTREVVYVGIALPKLVFQPAACGNLEIVANGASVATTGPLASMDAIIAQEFRKRMPAIVMRAVAGAVVKALAQYEARERGGFIAQVGVALVALAMNRGDQRTWQTLPKEFQFARFPRPAGNVIELRAAGSGERCEVPLPEGRIVLIHARAPSSGTLRAQAVKLR